MTWNDWNSGNSGTTSVMKRWTNFRANLEIWVHKLQIFILVCHQCLSFWDYLLIFIEIIPWNIRVKYFQKYVYFCFICVRVFVKILARPKIRNNYCFLSHDCFYKRKSKNTSLKIWINIYIKYKHINYLKKEKCIYGRSNCDCFDFLRSKSLVSINITKNLTHAKVSN